MTGFGVGAADCLGGTVGVEIRTVNHKYCDVKTRLAREFAPLESRLLGMLRTRIARGHVEVTVRWDELPPGRRDVRVDVPLARAYQAAYSRLATELGLSGGVDLALLAAQNVVSVEENAGEPDELWPGVAGALEGALESCVAMRQMEGRALTGDLLARTSRLGEL